MFVNPYTDFDIPVVMGPITTALRILAGALMPLMFVGEVFKQQVAVMVNPKTETHYLALCGRTFLALLVMGLLYTTIFMKVVALFDLIGMTAYNGADWGDFVENLSHGEGAKLSLTSLSIAAAASAFFATVLQYIDDAFNLVRFILLCILYVVGPLAWAAWVMDIGKSFLKGWFSALIQVSFWVVLFNIGHTALMAINSGAASYGNTAAAVTPVVNGIVIVILTLSIPMLTQNLFSGGHMGVIGTGMMGGLAAYASLQKMKQARDIAKGTGAGAVKGAKGIAAAGGWAAGKLNNLKGWADSKFNPAGGGKDLDTAKHEERKR